MSADENELLRIGDDLADADFSRRKEVVSGGARNVFAKTKTVASYPSAAGKMFACATCTILGADTEGSTPTINDGTDTFYAYLPTGRPVPPSGTYVECFRTNYCWVMNY